ncbi:hypothetical protein L2735_06480 [Shewanella olleyana]|uniref:hypothetical protein n=1 Tax=Shewanella olleyana TaxID=135626 RepID=UPI00200FC171|nr:hypothetical protein [Shewanella olleyana]MCL1066454.1 hypothetical protein [Shewanella olleyana]
MSNQRENLAQIDLNEVFSGIDEISITAPFEEYLEGLDSFYSNFKSDENTSLIRYFSDFDPKNFDDKEKEFVRGALLVANYDEAALRGENVLLFSEPIILAELSCINTPYEENDSAIRLISYLGTDKKITTQRTTQYEGLGLISKEVTVYQVHQIVIGVILPKRSKLESVKLARATYLHSDQKKLKNIQKLLKKASDLPQVLIQKASRKTDEINRLIRIEKDNFKALKGDIDVLEQEKANVEGSLKTSQNSLKKVQNELKTISKDFDNTVADVNQKSLEIDSLQSEIKSKSSFLKNEETRLNDIKNNIIVEGATLNAIKEELADAQREKNLTTFDTIGHSKETAKQLTPYYWFAGLTFLGLVFMAIYIYANGQDFTKTLPYLVHVSAWDILLSRLPLITATTLIIGGLSSVFFFLIKHIISLNTEKMTMLKAGILAEQITNSLDCKDMTDDQKLEFKRDTKIKLIMQVFSKSEPEVDKNNIIIEALKAMNSK